jgi:hypothetical protein
MTTRKLATLALLVGTAVGAGAAFTTDAQPQVTPEMAARLAEARGGAGKQEFQPFDKVTEGFEKVVSTADGKSLYTIYVNEKEGKVLAELPRMFDKQTYFVAPTFAEGVPGAQSSQIDGYMLRWKRIGDRLALIQPNLEMRSTGDNESKRSRDEQFTDRVVTDVPILTMGPGGGPVIDMSAMLVDNARELFPFAPRFNGRLKEIAAAKSYPENFELAFRAPVQPTGGLVTMHYSWSVLPESTGYKPREADYRVGFFVTPFDDLNNVGNQTLRTRYINRWKLEKADPSLKLSPPKEPVVFYIEHTTPIQYRNAVREGVIEWNKAFEQVGIINAIEVYQQDSRTGAHMDKDPEDVRYNFIRWGSNNQGFAIGPLRADPRTGQILDADVLMNDGWVRAGVTYYEKVLADAATETMTPETLSWLDARPEIDPRIQLLAPADRAEAMAERRQMLAENGPRPHGGHPIAEAIERAEKSREMGGLWSSSAQSMHAALCKHGAYRQMDMQMAALGLIDLSGLSSNGKDIDEIPDEFVNALIKDVIMHEVGHVLGLRHNFVASTVYTLAEINAAGAENNPITGSVMDYNATNYHYDIGETQGAFFMPTIGPYDAWAIRYGYSDDKAVEEILVEATNPLHVYHSDEHLSSADPRVRQRDMGKDALDFVEMELRLIQELRDKILERSVEEGDSWENARRAYLSLLSQHFRNVSTASNWIGGSYITRDVVGQGDTDPVTPVGADDQRRALALVIAQTFHDESFGITPELLRKMTAERNFDQGISAFTTEEAWTVHDTVLGVQSTAMTMVMNPTTLRRVLDNEFKISSDDDAFTLAEMMQTISDDVWSELDGKVARRFSPRDPMISSLRRNLQSAHADRLIDLALPGALPGAAAKPISDLAVWHLHQISDQIGEVLDGGDSMIDAYTMAHLSQTKEKIDRALEAQFVYNRQDI